MQKERPSVASQLQNKNFKPMAKSIVWKPLKFGIEEFLKYLLKGNRYAMIRFKKSAMFLALSMRKQRRKQRFDKELEVGMGPWKVALCPALSSSPALQTWVSENRGGTLFHFQVKSQKTTSILLVHNGSGGVSIYGGSSQEDLWSRQHDLVSFKRLWPKTVVNVVYMPHMSAESTKMDKSMTQQRPL